MYFLSRVARSNRIFKSTIPTPHYIKLVNKA